nr:zinc finger, CCHC-type [Tanacetum cinerariifolium]
VVAAMKHIASNFAKLDKFEGVDFRRWQKKMHFLLSSMSVVYVLTNSMLEDGGDNPTVEQVRKGAKWDNDDYVCRGLILNGMSDSLFDIYQIVESSKELWDSLDAKYMADDASSKKFLVSNFTNYKMIDSRPVLEQYNELLDFKHTLKYKKEELTLVELGSHLRIEESLMVQDSDKPKGNNVVGLSVVNMVKHNNSSRYNENKGKHKHHDNKMVDPNKKAKPTCWKYGKTDHIKRDYKGVNVGNKANGSGTKGSMDCSSNSLKGQNMFNKSSGFIMLHMYLRLFLCRMMMLRDGLTHEQQFMCVKIDVGSYESLNDGSILYMENESTSLVHERGCVDLRFSSGKIVSLLNVLHVPNIRKNLVSSSILNNCGYKQVTESNKFVLSIHGVFIGFGYLSNHMFRLNIVNDNIGSAFMSTFKLNDSILWHARLGHVHFKRMQDMSNDGLILAFDMDTESGCKEVVRLLDPKLKTLDKRGIECIFVRYAEHSKAFRFFSVPRSSHTIPNGTEDIGGSVVPEEVNEEVVQQPKPELIKSKRNRTSKNFGPEFQLYLIEGTRDEVSDQHSYCFNVEDDPKTFDEAMKSHDVAFWKKAINDEMDFIMGNNTRVLADLPTGCKPFGCKWIFKRKLKVDGTIEKFKARLVIQGFKQNSGIDYFDTYAPVARISTIRLLIAMASIHNLIIYHMDVKTTFLNGELKEEVYINQPQGFFMPGNENKVCKLIKSLYGLNQTSKQWHQTFDEVVWSNGYLLNQSEKCVYSKFDESGKRVIICLYVDDILIFGTDQVQVNLTKEFLSSRFSMKDMEKVDVILCIKIKHESNEIAISQSHSIEKVTEHPDSDSGYKEFKSLMNNEFTPQRRVTHQRKYPQRVNLLAGCFSLNLQRGMLLSGLADSLRH